MTKESSQETTTGKNLLPNNLVNGSASGITYIKNIDGSIKITGTASARVEPDLFNDTLNTILYPAGTYKNTSNRKIILYSNNYYVIEANSTITLNEDLVVTRIYFRIESGETNLNETYYPQIIKNNTTDDTYEPYTGGEASPSPDYPQEVEVVEGYENLFDKDNANIINCLINGTTKAIGNYNDAKTLYIPISGGLTYTIYKRVSQRFGVGSCSSIPSNNVTCSVAIQDNSSNKITITTNENDNYLAVFYYLNGVDTLTEQEILDSIMITKGTSSHPYVPYGNNYVDVTVRGKNLFDYDDLASKIQIFTINGNAENFTINGYGTYQYPISISPNEIISGSWSSTNLNGDVKVIYNDDTSENLFSSYSGTNVSGNINFIPTKNIKAIQFRTYGTSNITLNNFQIEKGLVATSYEPYQESIVPIPLNGNFIAGIGNYKDTLIVDKFGKCYLGKRFLKVVFDGTEAGWSGNSPTTGIYRFIRTLNSSYDVGNARNKDYIMSNYFRGVTDNSIGGMYQYQTQIYFNMDSSICSSVDEFKAWLSTHNTDVYYVSAQESLIDLNYTIDLKTFKGVSNITNSENANMKIRYVRDINEVINKIDDLETRLAVLETN